MNDEPAPIDTLYQSYGRGLYKITGEEQEDDIINSLGSNSGANNSTSVTMGAENLGSGYDTSTTIQTTGSLQSGKQQYNNLVPGYILGVDPTSGLAKLYIGNTINYLNWDGTTMTLSGNQSIYDANGTLRLQVFNATGPSGASFIFYAEDGTTQQLIMTALGINLNGSNGLTLSNSSLLTARGGITTQGATITSGSLNPSAHNTYNIGNSSGPLRWQTIYLINAPDVSSDARYKLDVKPLAYGLDEVCRLHSISFKREGDGRTRLGFLAQSVRTVIPEVVSGAEETSYGVAYEELIPVLVNAIRELEQRVVDLEDNDALV